MYSTTTGTDGQVTYLKRQFKIYLPGDADTDKIYIDKRLAVGTMYNQFGNEVLEAYVITGRTKFGKGGYGEGAHLLELNAKSSEEVSAKDNVELMVCDYIAPDDDEDDDTSEATLTCVISGRSTIRLGKSRTYSGIFYDEENALVEIDNPQWTMEAPEGIKMSASGATCVVSIPNDDDFIGAEIVLTLGDGGVNYKNAKMTVEVD